MRNILKITLVVALAVGLTVAFAPKAQAFHDDGVAHCNGCHTMHNSYEGAEVVSGGAGSHLLKGATISDTCLNCHGRATGSYRVMSALTGPFKADGAGAGGGDFIFLNEDGINDGHGAATDIIGERAGHNIDASALTAETTLTEAPGGGVSPYQTSDLSCASCHEPHGGKNFRFLHYSGSKTPPSHFSSTPELVADETSVFSSAANDNRSAYKDNVADWCGSCHGEFHSANGATTLVHPTGETVGSDIADNYNSYFGTDQTDTGADPYLEMVQVEWDSPTNTTSYTGDIPGSSKVMCLTCHRAHATQNPSAGRWDFNISIWDEEGSSGSHPTPNPYDATAGIHQRSLCNKCHVKDEGDL